MADIIGVQFQRNGKMYYFDANGYQAVPGEYVIVDTVRGADLAEVVMGNREIEIPEGENSYKKTIRKATAQDMQHSAENRAREREAYVICQKKIAEHQLEMKLVSVEYSFDNSRILFYFTANGRVDFRSLVKDLASVFRTRIELRQIGVRDEARMLGSLGPCGRAICCGTFLTDFQPVSIKMAKEQNLSLNPTKISGVCGRLMCCLKYEQEHYEQTRKRMPRIGREVDTPDGRGTVTDLNIVKETVSVRIADGDTSEIKEYPLEKIQRPGMAAECPGCPMNRPEANGSQEAMAEPDDILPEEGADLTEEAALLSEETEIVFIEETEQKTSPATEQPRGRKPEPGEPSRAGKPEKKRNNPPAREGKKQGAALGQPVKRENPKRNQQSGAQRPEPARAAAENVPAEPAGKPEGKQTPAPAGKPEAKPASAPTKKPKNNWSDQLARAISEMEAKKED